MIRLRARHIAIIVLLIVVGPVAIDRLLPADPRQYQGVSLEETVHTDVRFRNSSQNIDLAGMLFVPEGDGPVPAAVVIHGSGASNRENRWYLTLTKFLQDNGIAVLLPDKRGSEKSAGDWRTADFEELATDTLAALDFMLHQHLVEISRVGVIGMSQGGWIAPIVARDSDDLAFVVNMVGSAVTPKEQLLYEEDHNIRQMGFLPGISYLIALASTAHIRHVRMPQFYDRVADYDPIPLWDAMAVNALVLYGSDDTNVPSEESAARLQALDKASIDIIIHEGSGHALQDPLGEGNDLIRDEALAAIRDFILEMN
ncbi:MAG: alpha/beta fold hydrolase [Woeseiaceae bacterium]|nr:alpha/beta fold hydrolase [Woeseiaceae bacterium]NIP21636.1 alpha/beta fold hydrolase [Woeseiaceae bacterium]NIS90610.1 alpha/beta fold hydrolase [Woeseiaceae bacterium]